MSASQRATVYFDTALHRALRLKAAETGESVSDLVNRAVRVALAEDLDDLRDVEQRRREPSRPFEDFLRELADAGEL
jgi:hypothetical protein